MKSKVIVSSFLAPLAAHAANGIEANHNANAQERPNVILILADDLGYGDLQCYGGKNVVTPNVNRLAKSGIRFTDVHAVAATSTPSRYSLLTGEYSWRRPDTDIAPGDAGSIIRPTQYTLADVFHHAGYATGAVGKWHLGLGDKTGEQDWNAPLATSPSDLGFDYHYIMAATADRVPCVFIENGKVANYDPSAPIQVSYVENFNGEPTGRDNPELLYNLKSSHGHNMSIVNGIGRIGYMTGGGKALWKDENIADSITAHAISFIEQHDKTPFFLYFATNDVHVPRFPHDRFRGKNPMGYRGDAIAQFDWSVGQILNTLDRLGLTDNTLIILTSDNGPVLDDGYLDQAEELVKGHKPSGPYRGGKYSAFEGGTIVPAIVSWPAHIKPQKENPTLISHIDYFASLAALVNARLPKGSARDSQNRFGAIIGEDFTNRSFVIEQSANHTLSVRTKEWKYIEPNDGVAVNKNTNIELGNLKSPQLYNISKDPGEKNNLATTNPEQFFELQTILRKVRNAK